ncbi:uncharacterized protein LOC108904837 [Anoplophora glabripennis]|uniref:uncharacterized protein LOC108904837 n=1 Tax=Anoplophora glabripennis TaxID=217634 RepID=UPI0008741D3B|nr:uncharacterized protein LOC108904837 [Anoplophora glabripennis]
MTSTADLVADSTPDLTKKEADKPFLKLSWREKVSYIREVITVEPLITAYILASYLCVPAMKNLEFEKACRVNLGFNDSVCNNILAGTHENFTDHNDQVLVTISNMYTWKTPVETVMPLILILFLGSFSDRHKLRKPFLLLPIVGEFFAVIACILCVIFMDTWPLEAQGVSQTIIPSILGGPAMITMAAFAYIADVSTVEMRTLRMGVVQITLNIFSPIIQLISGVLFNKIGYYGILLIAAAFYLFALTYGIYCIKEPKQPVKESTANLLCDIFDPKNAVDTFSLICKKAADNNRVYILLVLVTIFVYNGVANGELNLFFLYAQRQVHWTVVEFSYLVSVNTIVHLIGTVVAIPLFTKIMNLSDPIIIVITFADKILCNFIFAMANTGTLMYVAVIVSLITGVSGVAIRSLGTKVVSINDLGKAQSLLSIFEAVAPAIATPVYNQVIYNKTFNVYPPAFFVFGIILYVICCILVMWMWIGQKRKNKKIAESTKDKSIPMESYTQTTHI